MQPDTTANSIRIINARLVMSDKVVDGGTVTVRDGRITSAGLAGASPPADAPIVDAGGAYIAPGFVDIHVHGGAGSDFMDGTSEAFEATIRCHLRHGTTSIVPTNTVGKHDRIMRFLELVRRFKASGPDAVRGLGRVVGSHLYGPYFAEEKIGCHPHDCRPPTEAEYRQYLSFADSMLLATCAPELPGAIGFYQAARALGVRLNAGHSNATWTEMQSAYEAGVRHVDHFFCAMSNYVSTRNRVGTPMQGGMLEYVLASDDMTTELIADGRHLSPELLRFPLKMLGVERVALVTDCSRALDMPPGNYVFGPTDGGGEDFYSDGSVGVTLDRKGLASSVRGMDFMIRQMVREAGIDLPVAVQMASLTPARILGLEGDIGSLAPGKFADLVMLDSELNVQRVWVQGVEAVQ
ncbi:N-acetylglucosamine-6-phosphate deacetylase [Humisphaera borealis]|uniref:N-acetylglucosamine-6-phosphate deacetylase n=1 Tax=Humisphaera borealis TaxID=2807512 RepID=A0A7M2WSV5_9BACT|nr:N-acetylglucosamine-6-phosphate deacetylase [Humisphaera borealis]QOV88262.1 N-acetylglucosamine-6-phosphate deacetylase [Humisphaera borealis]